MSRTSTRTRMRPHHLAPDRDAWIDLAFVLVLSAVALSGFGASFTGWSYLVVGLVGVVLAATVTHLSRALGWPLVAPVVICLGLFFVLGGPLALRSMGNTAFLPSGSTLGTLADQAIFGWKDFLTTLPPVDGDGPLLVLPLIVGLVAGVLGTVTARARVRTAWLAALLPVAAMTALLAAVILLGVRHPSSLLLQGAAFAALTLGWLALRSRRLGAVVHGGSGGWGRLAVGTALVLTAAGVALPASALLAPDNRDRSVVRNWVEPPFEIGKYPSPLAGFRKYVDPKGKAPSTNVYDRTLFTMQGVPEGTRVRFAALDRYDGMVWGASDDPNPGEGGDTFQRVSSTIDNPLKGEDVRATVTVGEGWSGVWLPTVGGLTGMRFEQGDTATKVETFRYNLATSTAVVPTGVNPGDVYSFTAVLPDDELTKDMTPASSLAPPPADTEFMDAPTDQWSEGASSDLARLLRIAKRLRTQGRYSDGVVKAERTYLAGHGLRRLDEQFVGAETMVGNDEQYAAVMALFAQKLGLQARVVVGAIVPDGGVVQGKDVQAWVEVRANDGSWRTLPTEEFMSDKPPTEQTPQTDVPMSGTVVPPPNPIPPPSDAGDPSDAELKKRKADGEEGEDAEESAPLPAWIGIVVRYVGLPLLVLLAVVGAILGAKALRRRRRRQATSVSARFVGGWWELVDHARDLGQPVPLAVGLTRREQARGIVSETAPALARRADSSVFGPRPPEPDAAAEYWQAIENERRQMSSRVPWHRRARAALNLRTLTPALRRQRAAERDAAEEAGAPGAEAGPRRRFPRPRRGGGERPGGRRRR